MIRLNRMKLEPKRHPSVSKGCYIKASKFNIALKFYLLLAQLFQDDFFNTGQSRNRLQYETEIT